VAPEPTAPSGGAARPGGGRRLGWRRLRLAAEALVALGRARWALRRPYEQWGAEMGARADDGPAHAAPGAPLPAAAREVGWAVQAVARRVPWRSDCLPQALAGQAMLRRRGVDGRIVFGARSAADRPGLDLHAWLLVGPRVVTGGPGHRAFTPVVAFGGDDG